MLAHRNATGAPERPDAGKAVGEGAPSQKTCPLRSHIEPLAEGGFVFRRILCLFATTVVVALLAPVALLTGGAGLLLRTALVGVALIVPGRVISAAILRRLRRRSRPLPPRRT